MSDEEDTDEEKKLEKKLKTLQCEKERLREKRKNADKKQLLAKLQQDILNLQETEQSSSSRWKDSAGPSASSKKSRNDNYNLEQRQQVESDDENISEEEGNQLMSDTHKKRLQENRPYLVENMTPDDIFNVLLSNKVLTTSEVSKIRESSGREATNEELLDTLIRKPDRAFAIFVDALRKSLQDHLADLLQRSKRKIKRKAGDINVNVDVEHLQKDKRYHSDEPLCSCEEVEKQILMMAKNAFSTIRRRNDSPASYEQFRKEVTGTNAAIKESLEVMNTIKLFCKHDGGRQLENITYGSIFFRIHCHTFDGLQELWNMYTSGALLDRLQKGLVTRQLKQRYHLKKIQLRVRMSEKEYQVCVRELLALDVSGSESMKFACNAQTMRDPTRSKAPYRIAFKEIHHNVSTLNLKVKPSVQPRKTRSTRENNCKIQLRSKSGHI